MDIGAAEWMKSGIQFFIRIREMKGRFLRENEHKNLGGPLPLFWAKDRSRLKLAGDFDFKSPERNGGRLRGPYGLIDLERLEDDLRLQLENAG
jgi:hypothetical protein